MKIPKQDVSYAACYHNEEEGIPFYLEGGFFERKREALEEIKRLQPKRAYPIFLAEVITRPARKTRRKPTKRKQAA